MQLLASEVGANYYTNPPAIVSLLILSITYIQAATLHTQGRLNNHAACSLYTNDPGYGTCVMGVMTIRNIVPRVGIKSTFLAFRTSVLTITTLPDETTVPMPTCVCSCLPERSMHS